MIKENELSKLRDRVRKIVKEELALSQFAEDGDGDFSFNYERFTYELLFDPKDPAYLWIRGASRYPIPTFDQLESADSCINAVNRKCKLVKLFRSEIPDDEGVHWVTASASLIVDSIEALSADTVERALFLVKIGKRDFYRLFEESDALEAPAAFERAGRVEPMH